MRTREEIEHAISLLLAGAELMRSVGDTDAMSKLMAAVDMMRWTLNEESRYGKMLDTLDRAYREAQVM